MQFTGIQAGLVALAAAVAAAGAAAWLGLPAFVAALVGGAAAGGAGVAAARSGGAGARLDAPGARRASEPGDGGLGLLEQLPLALVLLGRGGQLRFANAAAVELFGPVPLGEPLAIVVRARPLAEAVAAVAAGGDAATAAFALMQSRGRRILLAHVHPLAAGPDHGDAAVMLLVEDRTRTAQVEQMLRDFIANASHELKTPLASITGFIETLRGPARDDPAAAERFLPVMAQQAERMKRLIEDLMSLNRIEMNAHVRPEGEVALFRLVRAAAAALAPLAEGAGVTIEVDLPEDDVVVTGDRDELGQLFSNLVDNAIKYGASGGAVRVHLHADEPGRSRMVGVSVTDRGPGIERDHIPRLTERFYRVPSPGGKAKGGTGLGLAIVKHILNRHRGDLAIRSEPGQGASFTAWLPRAERADSPGRARAGS